MKAEVDAALSEIRHSMPVVDPYPGRPLDDFRWCNGVAFALGLLELILAKTSRWNVVARWVLGAVVRGIQERLKEECEDGLP